jgi:hypothetical protein
MTAAALQKLARYWVAPDSRVHCRPASEESVSALEARYGIQLPGEFRAYLLQMCPEDNQLDGHCTQWWSVDRIKNIPDEYQHKIENEEIAKEAWGYLFFADYMVWCWVWAICCAQGPNYGRVVVIGHNDRFVADSFGEFLERYMRGDEDLL